MSNAKGMNNEAFLEFIEKEANRVYTIVLDDGTTIDGLHMNGNNFVSDVAIDPRIFAGNLRKVVISDGEHTETHTNMAYVKAASPEPDKFYFVLRDVPEREIEQARVRSDVDYLAMMMDVEI